MLIDYSYFYTAEPVYKEVSFIEFCEFLEDYPRELKKHIENFAQGSFTTYYDEEICDRYPLGKVATCSTDKSQGKSTFIIIENYEELFNSRTGKRDADAKKILKEQLKKYREQGLVLSRESEFETKYCD